MINIFFTFVFSQIQNHGTENLLTEKIIVVFMLRPKDVKGNFDSCLSLVNHVTTTSFHLFIFPDLGKVLLNLNIPVN